MPESEIALSVLHQTLDSVDNIQNLKDTSLFKFIKRSTVCSSVFIEKTLAGEEILKDLMLNIMNLYVGLILTAMDLNRFVTNTQRVRDIMSVVATESFKENFGELPIDTEQQLMSFFYGCQPTMADGRVKTRIEELKDDVNYWKEEARKANARADARDEADRARAEAERAKADTERARAETEKERAASIRDQRNKANEPKQKSYYESNFGKEMSVSSAKILDADVKNANLPSGRIIELTFDKISLHLFLQLMPRFVPTEVAQQFVAINFPPSLTQRWVQRSAGEISFFKDFLLSHDLTNERFKALKADTTGILREMEQRRKQNRLNLWWSRIKYATKQAQDRHNFANTILIFEKRSFDTACNKSGFNFKIYANRQRFFDKTFAMMLCTVDPMYNKVEMFYNGLPAMSEFTFDQIKRSTKTDSMDLVSVMKQYASGMAPKF